MENDPIVVERKTGPRISQSPPRSLGYLAVHRAAAVPVIVASIFIGTASWVATFVRAHSAALAGVGIHLVVLAALTLPGYQRASYDPQPSTACAQATSFLARTSGLSGTQQTNYTTLICGLETDGIGCSSKLDALYIMGAPDATTSLL